MVETELRAGAPASEFHRQYDDIHLPEILAIDGFVAARRYRPAGHSGPFLAIYDIEADDLEAVRQALARAIEAGSLTTPDGVADDPAPRVRFFEQIAERTAP